MEENSAVATGRSSKAATIRYNVHSQTGAYAGRTVADVRRELSGLWNIAPDAKCYKGKEVIADDYIIGPNEMIDFHKNQGEKG